MIHGDRIEAFAGALVAVMSSIFVAHVEGGAKFLGLPTILIAMQYRS